MPMNLNQARIVDPILTKIALGYTNEELIGHELFPDVQVATRSAKVLKFGKQSFRKINMKRAPGADKKRISVGFAAETVRLNQDALEAVVPTETADEAQKVPGVDMAKEAVFEIMEIVKLNREIEAAELAQNVNNYDDGNKVTMSGTDKWDNPNSDPERDILDGREAVRRKIGRYPNKLALSAGAFAALCVHPKIKGHFKYTSGESITEQMLARLFKVAKVVVGKAVYLEEDADEADAQDVWSKSAILAFVPTNSKTRRRPSYGYNYNLTGNPNVKKPYFENRNDSWIYPVNNECAPQLTSADAGFLFDQVV